jgi:hypothetical protein
MVSAILKTKIMIDKKKLIEELLDCVADATDTETQITSLTMAGMLMNEVLDEALTIPVVSGSVTPFGDSIKLLRDLADLQNGAPLERHRKEWEETMEQVYDFLNRWEGL